MLTPDDVMENLLLNINYHTSIFKVDNPLKFVMHLKI